jgi:probable HAF family extracellular repeat protein
VGSAINDNGTIVGYSRVEAMVYRDGRMTGLSRRAALLANGVNDAEEIVGMLENNHAFLFSNNYMSDIGTLYGGQGQSWAVAINGRGQVVGSSVSPDGAMTHAFLFEGGVMTDLGTLYGGYSYALGVNDDGVIVGESDGAAFIYRDGVMTDLNLITPHDAGLLRLELAWDINAGGQIVGRGVFLYRGSHAVLLNPTGTTQ